MSTSEDYVSAFVESYRGEVCKLSEKEKSFLRTEETLLPPCQVEILEFSQPYRLVLLCFFGESRPDLETSFRKSDWQHLSALVEELASKHKVGTGPLFKMIKGFNSMDSQSIYSLDGFKGALGLCFPHDVRLGNWALAKTVEGSSAVAVAKDVFHLNLGQAQDC